jgi:hypothetical protein
MAWEALKHYAEPVCADLKFVVRLLTFGLFECDKQPAAMFEERAVAFLDILGFKNLITNAERQRSGLDRLNALKTVIEGHVRFDNANVHQDVPVEMHPKYLFVSDTIILSAPLKHGKYDGLDVIVVKTIQIAQKVLELGHLIRGGISVGPVWHEDRNIFGSGYIDAFLTEQRANHPCVMLLKN